MSRATAYHEAGHAVAVAMLGESVIRIHINHKAVSIRTDRGAMTEPVLGLVESTVQVQLPMFAAMALKASAGPAAEQPANHPTAPSVESIYAGL